MKTITLHELLSVALELNNDSIRDILKINIQEGYTINSKLKISEYSNNPDIPGFTAWTSNYVYFPFAINDGDGGYDITCVPRNPNNDIIFP